MDREAEVLPESPFPLVPWTFLEDMGWNHHPISVSERHGLTPCPSSLTAQCLQIVSLIISQSIHPSIQALSHHKLIQHQLWAGLLLQKQA